MEAFSPETATLSSPRVLQTFPGFLTRQSSPSATILSARLMTQTQTQMASVTFLSGRTPFSGYFGVLRVDGIHDLPPGLLNGTVWFQTDGTGNFDDVIVGPIVVGGLGGQPVSEPGTLLLLGSGLLGVAGYGKKKFFRKA